MLGGKQGGIMQSGRSRRVPPPRVEEELLLMEEDLCCDGQELRRDLLEEGDTSLVWDTSWIEDDLDYLDEIDQHRLDEPTQDDGEGFYGPFDYADMSRLAFEDW